MMMRKFAVRWWVVEPRARFDEACAACRHGIGFRVVRGVMEIFYE